MVFRYLKGLFPFGPVAVNLTCLWSTSKEGFHGRPASEPA